MSIMQTFREGPRYRPATWVQRVNWPVFWTGQLWWFMETSHYGWNALPQSDAELICDGMAMLIFALAWRPAVNGT